MASSRHTTVAVQLAVQAERIRCLEAQIESLTKALEQALSQPAVVYQGDPGRVGPGFGVLAQQTLANAEPESESTPRDLSPAITWLPGSAKPAVIPEA